jgi:hypothetical protein
MGRQQVLVILFIPSHDRDEKDLKTRDLWADAALNLFADLFEGATAFDTYAGIYRDKVRGKDLKDKPILVESYTEIERVRNLDILNNLVSFICTFPELSASCDPAHEALNEPADFWAQARH